jgi:hypothetical protein
MPISAQGRAASDRSPALKVDKGLGLERLQNIIFLDLDISCGNIFS